MFLEARKSLIENQMQKHGLNDWSVKVVNSIPGFPRLLVCVTSTVAPFTCNMLWWHWTSLPNGWIL